MAIGNSKVPNNQKKSTYMVTLELKIFAFRKEIQKSKKFLAIMHNNCHSTIQKKISELTVPKILNFKYLRNARMTRMTRH